jgi:MYXO-CTERM domain-containing protein
MTMIGFARSLLVVVPVVSGVSTARAALSAEQVYVHYNVTDAKGERQRLMLANESFLNQARCACGQSILVSIYGREGQVDPAEPIEAFVGPRCDVAEEMPDGPFEPCVKVHVGTGADLLAGVLVKVHPAFFVDGVDPAGGRLIDDPTTMALGSCEDGLATAGAWVCTPMANGTPGCQAEDFGVKAHELKVGIHADFTRPREEVWEVEAVPHEEAIEVKWSVEWTGDISGFRVLCEDAATGEYIPGRGEVPPDLTSIEQGIRFYTTSELCEEGPFSTVQQPALAGDGSCGDGVVDPGEACDDGDDNALVGLCGEDCTLQVGAGLHALAWEHVCTGHVGSGNRSVLVDNLPADRAYNLVLVAYDHFGNPRPVGKVLGVAPEAPSALRSELNCRTGANGQGAWALSLLVGLVALARRRRV